MHVDIRRQDDVVIVDLEGKLSAGLGDEILRETVATLLRDRWCRIVLNMSGVTFMDSAGVGELVAALRAVRAQGGDLKLLNAGGRVHSTLYMTRLLPVFELFSDEAEALRRFREA